MMTSWQHHAAIGNSSAILSANPAVQLELKVDDFGDGVQALSGFAVSARSIAKPPISLMACEIGSPRRAKPLER